MWSPRRSAEPQPIQRWVGSVVLVLNEMVLVVCSWLGNSPRIAQQSYLLVTEDDFTKAAGVAKVMVEGGEIEGAGRPSNGKSSRLM